MVFQIVTSCLTATHFGQICCVCISVSACLKDSNVFTIIIVIIIIIIINCDVLMQLLLLLYYYY
jgi:hypothetical protein